MSTAPTLANTAQPERVGILHQLGVDTGYTLLGFPIAVVSFSVIVAGFSAGLGTLVVVVGLPILAGTLVVARFFADVERMRIPAVLRRPLIRPTYRAALDEAVTQTQETLDELRALSRGIAPPVLTDRGLPSALAALAVRCTVPVELAVDPGLGTPAGRLDAAVETAVYFAVAEALTNVAKHSSAANCWVTVAHGPARIGVEIVDDGDGGAHVAKDHGLSGLADRVRATGGTLTVVSPAGGPTTIGVELPC